MAAATSTTTPTAGVNKGTHRNDVAYQLEDPTHLLINRLTAYKHVVENLIVYFAEVEGQQKTFHKEWLKLGKTLQIPFKDSGIFEQDGLAKVWTDLHQNTINQAQFHSTLGNEYNATFIKPLESSKLQIKELIKELHGKEGLKGTKHIDKLRADTQGAIEHLGRSTAQTDAHMGGLKASHDPYLISQHVHGRIHKQVLAENDHMNNVLVLQNRVAQFEISVVQKIQELFNQYSMFATREGDQHRNGITGVAQSANALPPDHEWKKWTEREAGLITPDTAPRNAKEINFPGRDHEATVPICEGLLNRKGTMLKKYDSHYYVLTKAGYLHEFASSDLNAHPEPKMSLYLPDCRIGFPSATARKPKWSISGKDHGKGLKLGGKSEYIFKAGSFDEVQRWLTGIKKIAGISIAEDATYSDDEGEGAAAQQQPPQPTQAAAMQPGMQQGMQPPMASQQAGITPMTQAPMQPMQPMMQPGGVQPMPVVPATH